MHQEGFYIFSRFAHTKNMESQKMQALRLSLEIGAAMMESGGEVRRTEDTVTRINYAAGATDAQVEGESANQSGKISNRPSSIAMDRTNLDKFEYPV